MAIAITKLTSAFDTTDGTSFTSASVSPTASRLLILAVESRAASSPVAPTISTTLTDVTFSPLTDLDADASALWRASNLGRLTFFVAKSGAAPGSGTVTMSGFGAVTQTNCAWALLEVDGADLSGTALQAIQQVVKGTTASGASVSATLAAAAASDNRPLSAVCHSINEDTVVASGWSELSDDGGASAATRMQTQWRSDAFDTAATGSWATGTAAGVIVALEIKASAALSPPANTVAPALSGTAQVGETLSCSDGTWTGNPAPTFTYQWEVSDDGSAGWTEIGGATNDSYELQAAEEDKFVRCVVTGTNSEGNDTAESDVSDQITGAGGDPPPDPPAADKSSGLAVFIASDLF